MHYCLFGATKNVTQVKKLANLGTAGRWKNNMHRELVQLLSHPALRDAEAMFELPMRARPVPSMAVCNREQTFVLPHVMFSIMYHKHRENWETHVRGSRPRQAQFWDDMQTSPLFASHPVQHRADYAKLGIPIGIHGDAVPVTGVGKSWCKSVESFSWSSVLAQGQTLDTMFYMYGVFTGLISRTADANTLDVAFRIMCWSLYWLYEGKWPDRDPWDRVYRPGSAEGQKAPSPLADGHFACIWVIKGDLEWFGKTLKLPWFSSAKPCCFCPAESTAGSTLCWSDFRKTKQTWLGAAWTPDDWRVAFPNLHRLFGLPGVSILTVAPDWMHGKHLGTDQYVYGSILHCLVYEIMPGSWYLCCS